MNLHEYLNLHENKHHGNYLMPITLYHTKIPTYFTNINIHWHEELELVLIKHGRCTFNIDLKSYDVMEGDILILNPYILHCCKQYKNEYCEAYALVLNMSMLDTNHDSCSIKFINPIMENSIVFPYVIKPNTPGYQQLKEYLTNSITTYTEKKKGFELELKSYLYLFLHTLFTHIPVEIPDTVTVDDAVTDKIKVILQYIKENYSEPITVKDLAELLNFSEYHFMRFFKKNLGVTCIEYINNYRLNISAAKLCTTNLSVMEIALDCGFNNISYFNKLFKEKYKQTPKDFRKNTLTDYVSNK